MARKSRKQAAQTEAEVKTSLPLIEIDEKLPTAIYGRLSAEDTDDHDSMETQIALVQDFVDRNDELEYVDTYFDNGFTGTNFKRPAFTRLMNDVRQKKIRCIVVKDLSRFGRNYLEAGYYIETVFPFLGVRLLAVTDHFDSDRKEDMESLALPIRNMVNSLYAKDISKKVWTSLQKKKEKGYALGNLAPFGYIRNPATMRNEVDPEAAFYVQLIFQWKLMEVSSSEIQQRLFMLNVPPPREYQKKGMSAASEKCKKWGVSTILDVLRNQTYVGDTIANKTNQKLFAGQAKHSVPEADWVITKNTHPAIIARDDFERVQVILDEGRKKVSSMRAATKEIRKAYPNDLAGLVFCADCGRAMIYDRLPHGAEEPKKICYYICKARKADDKCIGHQITEKLLKALIMDEIHLFLYELSDKRRVLEELQRVQDVANPVYRAKGKILSLTDQLGRMAEKREKLYADYVSGIVDLEDYQMIREDYTRQYEQCKTELKEAENEKTETERKIAEYLEMTGRLEEHLDDRVFDAELVKTLIQKIEVGRNKNIRITFRFKDIFTEMQENEKEAELG